MASLGQKNGVFSVRFRLNGKSFRHSLGVKDRKTAETALNRAQVALHHLKTGVLALPADVDVGLFVVSGGSIRNPRRTKQDKASGGGGETTVQSLVDKYLDAQSGLLAPSYLSTQRIHLGHFLKFLGKRRNDRCSTITQPVVAEFLRERTKERSPVTANKERITLVQLFKWAISEGVLTSSPAAGIPKIKGGSDRPPFRTIAEIEEIIERGGMSDREATDLWECLYLSPSEIAELLTLVRKRSTTDYGHLLHVIPAYTDPEISLRALALFG